MNASIKPLPSTVEPISSQKVNISHTRIGSLGTTFNSSRVFETTSVYPPPRFVIVAKTFSIYLAMCGGRGFSKISAANWCELVRLMLFLLLLVCGFRVTCWLVVVQRVLMSIDNAWHAISAWCMACKPGSTNYLKLRNETLASISASLLYYQRRLTNQNQHTEVQVRRNLPILTCIDCDW